MLFEPTRNCTNGILTQRSILTLPQHLMDSDKALFNLKFAVSLDPKDRLILASILIGVGDCCLRFSDSAEPANCLSDGGLL